ncbi:unnamed protein product [Arctogadus glacialis]
MSPGSPFRSETFAWKNPAPGYLGGFFGRDRISVFISGKSSHVIMPCLTGSDNFSSDPGRLSATRERGFSRVKYRLAAAGGPAVVAVASWD